MSQRTKDTQTFKCVNVCNCVRKIDARGSFSKQLIRKQDGDVCRYTHTHREREGDELQYMLKSSHKLKCAILIRLLSQIDNY